MILVFVKGQRHEKRMKLEAWVCRQWESGGPGLPPAVRGGCEGVGAWPAGIEEHYKMGAACVRQQSLLSCVMMTFQLHKSGVMMTEQVQGDIRWESTGLL